jgi:hypothetical protein
MVLPTPTALADLYQTDETAWLDATAELVRSGRLDQVDASSLAEYLTDMARRDRREVLSRLAVLIAHLLKWHHQPDHRSGSWRGTIEVQRQELAELLEGGVLRYHATEVLPKAYANGVRQAVAETGMPAATFPEGCPYSLDAILSEPLEEAGN